MQNKYRTLKVNVPTYKPLTPQNAEELGFTMNTGYEITEIVNEIAAQEAEAVSSWLREELAKHGITGENDEEIVKKAMASGFHVTQVYEQGKPFKTQYELMHGKTKISTMVFKVKV